MSQHNRQVVFLFGAGISAKADLPLAGEITPAILSGTNIYQHTDGRYRPLRQSISGQLQYQVSSAIKEVNLGFTALKTNVSGTELDAQIKSIKEGWKKDGSQEVELKLNLTKDRLKSVSLVVDGAKTELERRGHFGSGNSYTYTYESKLAFPANGQIVVEIFDQVQTFNTPFKLENISLLGAPLAQP